MVRAPASSESSTLRDPLGDTLHPNSDRGAERAESCDYCGSASLEWRKCKLICAACRQINKSCADL